MGDSSQCLTSAVNTAKRSGVMMPRSTLIRRFGFFKSFKLEIRLRIRLRYLTPVSFSSLKIAMDKEEMVRLNIVHTILSPSSTLAASSTGSADPSGSSEMEKAPAMRSRDFNLKSKRSIIDFCWLSLLTYRTSSNVCDAAYSLETEDARESCRSIILFVSDAFPLFVLLSGGDGLLGFVGGVDVLPLPLLFAGLDFSSFEIGPDDVSIRRKQRSNSTDDEENGQRTNRERVSSNFSVNFWPQ